MGSFYGDILKSVMKEKKDKTPGFFDSKDPDALPKENQEFRRNLYGENFDISNHKKEVDIPEEKEKKDDKKENKKPDNSKDPKKEFDEKPEEKLDERFKEYDFSKKKASFEMRKRIRDINKTNLENFKSKLETGELLKGYNVDLNDPHYEKNLIKLKTDTLKNLHKVLQDEVSSNGGVAAVMKRELFNNGALDTQARGDIDSIANKEHRMALLHARDYLDKNLHFFLSKTMKNNANSNLSELEKKMKDYTIRNSDGTYSINPDGTPNTKSLVSSIADSKAVDMLNANTDSAQDSRENNKVMNAATLLAANRPIYVR